ncbi:GspH/FimT family pseudopilin [Halomonas sp. HNIBRBA4712]|uniref:GspH/FimT family pseudopilin n=1 Tax=Halomonas sp. HNIBRBA4712 TaxID=3373087 RepID=UPI003747242F
MALRRKRSMAGFTLLELLVAIAIIALMASVGLPNFARMLEVNRVVSATNEFKTALNYARSEAVRRNTYITLVPLAGNWAAGWEVRTQSTTLRQWPAASNQLSVEFGVPQKSNMGQLRFSSLGRLDDEGISIPRTTFIAFAVDQQQRCIRLEPSGLSRVLDVHQCPFPNKQ